MKATYSEWKTHSFVLGLWNFKYSGEAYHQASQPPPIPDKRGIKAPCCYSWLLHSICWRLFGGAMPLETGVSFFILCLLQSFSHLLRTILKTLITHDYIHSKQKSNKPKRTSWLFNCPIARKNWHFSTLIIAKGRFVRRFLWLSNRNSILMT